MKKTFGKRNMHKNAGFTLVETLVAITILMIAIAGPLTVAEKGLSAAIYARDQLVGSYLAQDGMEYIKNTVDSNELAIQSSDPSRNWLYDAGVDIPGNQLSSCSSNNSSCTIDTVDGGIYPCSSGPCSALYLTSGGYRQNQSGSLNVVNDTENFTRTFYIQTFSLSNGGNAANVVVTVTWPGDVTGGGGVTLEDTFYNTPLQ